MEMPHMLPEDKEKSNLIGGRQIDVLFSYVDRRLTEHDGMLAIDVLYAMYRRKSRSSKSLKDKHTITTKRPVQVLPMPLYTAHYKNSSCIPIAFNLCRS
jgi:hypothetical protein